MDDEATLLQAKPVPDRMTSRGSTEQAASWPAARRELPGDRPDPAGGDDITFHARVFLRASLGCIGVLVGIAVLVSYLAYFREAAVPRVVLHAFLLNEEQNIPTFFAFSLLLLCSALLTLIGARAHRAQQAFSLHWVLLAGLFFLGAFDEAARLHERLIGPIRGALDTSGWMYFAWIIPAGALVAVLAVVYLPFLRALPPPFGRLFVLSGALYLGGALGVEMPGGAYYERHGDQTFTYQLITTVEETLEMLGLTVFAYSLMRFLARRAESVRLGFREG